MTSVAVRRFLPLLDEVASDFCRLLQTRVEREGAGPEGQRSLTFDPSPDLFRFALEGQRSTFFNPRGSTVKTQHLWCRFHWEV